MSNPELLKGNLNGLQHLEIPETDLDNSVEFYEKLEFIQIL